MGLVNSRTGQSLLARKIVRFVLYSRIGVRVRGRRRACRRRFPAVCFKGQAGQSAEKGLEPLRASREMCRRIALRRVLQVLGWPYASVCGAAMLGDDGIRPGRPRAFGVW